ncbi:MAG: hypothetical protein Ct9H300mP1_35350 [Planctomycetaceae bacterium]|nr:MAG: hypothetical protein Ct9H300mP1_35350 [Planctomycetaceae bacterium]
MNSECTGRSQPVSTRATAGQIKFGPAWSSYSRLLLTANEFLYVD